MWDNLNKSKFIKIKNKKRENLRKFEYFPREISLNQSNWSLVKDYWK
jgi:hypothetical protein